MNSLLHDALEVFALELAKIHDDFEKYFTYHAVKFKSANVIWFIFRMYILVFYRSLHARTHARTHACTHARTRGHSDN